ncbi:tryptophan synthase subunit alpha [Shimazuella sp. AN120528]|uniref:tryptophan synthase subunit alpha n=1 Tax=Shimazuella soli TaxID=1892854 RepID=UPI001F116F5F|nr:tryptophan synthase subunit alpha [Shimazuella soli]MCH5584867.1 tryptophan synthase subunit alpha [Shimazuella soli]
MIFYSQRNQKIWQQMKEQYEALLIGYLIAGHPNVMQSTTIIENALLAGLDILELGIPSKNPHLDGPVIQEGHAKVKENVDQWFIPFVKDIRQRIQKPIWVMSYQSDLFQSDIFEQLVRNQLIDALLIPDCSIEEREEIGRDIRDYGIDIVHFVGPNMTDQEIATISQKSSIVYAQTYSGRTGSSTATFENLPIYYERIKRHTSSLVVAGFGIKKPDNVRMVVESHFDGAVVGSALVECCNEQQLDKLYDLITEMKSKTSLYEIKG